MSNGRKTVSKDATAELTSRGSARTVPRKWNLPRMEIGSEIRNLPDGITLTQEILLNNVCRICATYYDSGPGLVSLYLSGEGKRPLSKIANAFLPIKVKEDDGLSKVACLSCAKRLYVWRRMWDGCSEIQKILVSQAELLDGTRSYNRVEKCELFETVQSVLATYLNTSLTELECLKCNLKTSSEEFYHHLSSKHEDVRDREAVEAFVRDHVTFVEALDSDDGDCTSVVSSASVEASEVRTRLSCPICRAGFSTSSRLFQHLTEHDVNLDSIPCCGFSRNRSELLIHLREEHTTDSLLCNSSSQVAVNTAESATHTARYDTEPKSDVTVPPTAVSRDEINQKRIPAVCPDCNRTFSNKYNMLNHMKSHSETSVKYDCECGKSYTTRGNLLAHRRITHLGELRFTCAECGDRFPSRSASDVHSRLHSGVRPFPCSVCSRSFRGKSSLNKHLETHGPRRFECELCGKRFRRKAHLRYHVGTHPRRLTS